MARSRPTWGIYQYNVWCTLTCMQSVKYSDENDISLPNDKILDGSKLKAFADDKINVNKKIKFALGRIESIVGKGENAGYQHFLLFPQCFQKAPYMGVVNSCDCVVKS